MDSSLNRRMSGNTHNNRKKVPSKGLIKRVAKQLGVDKPTAKAILCRVPEDLHSNITEEALEKWCTGININRCQN